jgi:para-aminobenzoate synthetase component 1
MNNPGAHNYRKPYFLHITDVSPEVLFQYAQTQKNCIWLDSCPFENNHSPLWPGNSGRYTYLAYNPSKIFLYKDGHWHLEDKTILNSNNPFRDIKEIMAEYPLDHDEGLPPWQGGLAGYFSYDLARYVEDVPLPSEALLHMPEIVLGMYSVVWAFDHLKKSCFLISTGYPATNNETRAFKAQADLKKTYQDFLNYKEKTSPPKQLESGIDHFTPLVGEEDYKYRVQKVIDYIKAGDIFQANLSRPFSGELNQGNPPELYLRLRQNNPAPFSAYFDARPCYILSSSPERFLNVDAQGHVETKPIKGTRPRFDNPVLDQKSKTELLASEKEKSENLMIVDLLRNDISKSCEPGSVKVEKLWDIETFKTVHHLVSTVVGKLKPGLTAIDLLELCFPGGSITGAPKKRAMEIISECEVARREIYCGSLGFFGFDGAMGTNILIRTIAINGEKIMMNSGGGIVADSVPQSEYDETNTKIKALEKLSKEVEMPREERNVI